MGSSSLPLCAVLLLTSAVSFCADIEPPDVAPDYAARRQWLLDLYKQPQTVGGNPKGGMVRALAQLQMSNGAHAQSLDYASKVMDFRSSPTEGDSYGEFFAYPLVSRFLYMFGDKLSPEQREHLKAGLLNRARDLLSHGTENHAMMRISSAYLLAQYFPGETWHDRAQRTLTSEQLMQESKALLLKRGKNFLAHGNNEMLSSTYAIVNIYPLLSLIDFARDPQVTTAAEALAIYHLAQLAANDFDGHILSPFNRQNAQQHRFGPPQGPRVSRYSPVTAHVAWLYWGQNRLWPEDMIAAAEPAYPVLFALSNWTPPEVINRIAQGAGTPYALRSWLGFFGYWGETKRPQPDGETLRSVWRDRDFAIGSSAGQRLNPAGFFMDYNLFSIVWKSHDRYRYLECSHPYWRSDLGEDDWNKSNTSPFQQMAHHKNAAIVLFNIPDKDPFAGQGEQKHWVLDRDGHYDKLIQIGQCRFPKSVDELVRDGDWCFFREGDVYVGIRCLRPASKLRSDLTDNGVDDFHVLKSRFAKTGFIFEIGTRQSRGSFADFQARLKANAVQVDWDQLQATYRTTDGDEIKLRYNPDLTPGPDGLIRLFPQTWINGQPPRPRPLAHDRQPRPHPKGRRPEGPSRRPTHHRRLERATFRSSGGKDRPCYGIAFRAASLMTVSPPPSVPRQT